MQVRTFHVVFLLSLLVVVPAFAQGTGRSDFGIPTIPAQTETAVPVDTVTPVPVETDTPVPLPAATQTLVSEEEGMVPRAYIPLLARQADLGPPRPDLRIVELNAHDHGPLVGELVSMSIIVENAGEACSEPYVAAWSPTGAGNYWLGKELGPLCPGEWDGFNWVYTFVKSGRYSSRAMVDLHREVTETNETNNTASLVFQVHDP